MDIFFSNIKSDVCNLFEQQKVVQACDKLNFKSIDFKVLISGSVWEKSDNTISVGKGEPVIVQFPTGYGEEFDNKLIDAIKEFEAVLVSVVYSAMPNVTSRCLSEAESVIIVDGTGCETFRNKVNSNKIINLEMDDSTDEIVVRKTLLDAVVPYISRKEKYNKYSKLDKEGKVVHCAFALHDKYGTYSVYVGIVMLSLLKNTKSMVCFHILHDESLSTDNRVMLNMIADQYGSRVEYHLIDSSSLQIDNEGLKRYSVGCMYRCYLPNVLYYLPKVIYLDADLLVLKDIRELWDVDLGEYCLAGVHDIGFENGIVKPGIVRKGQVRLEEYVNSGLLVMNLEEIRKRGDLLQQAINFVKQNPDTDLPDQDALNYLYAGSVLLLDNSWNTYTRYERRVSKEVKKVVYHYMGQRNINYSDPTDYDKLYLQTMQETPWGYSQVEQRLFLGLQSSFDKVDMLQRVLRNIKDIKKKRIIIGKDTPAMREFETMICLREEDYYVGDNMANQNGCRNGIAVRDMKALEQEEKGTFIAFVLPEAENGRAMDILKDMGYINGEDYIVIPRCLTAFQGGYWV